MMLAVGGDLEPTGSFGNQTLAFQAGSNRFQVVVRLVILLDLLLDAFSTITAFVPFKQYLNTVIQLLALTRAWTGFAL